MRTKLLALIFIAFQTCGFAQTQMDLISNASNEASQADKQLSEVYNKILTQYQSDTLFIKNFKIAQNIWIELRDAQMNMKFPDYQNYYGSILPMCKSEYYTLLTNERIKMLMVWINGIAEGDGCAGSVRTAE